MFTKEFQVIFLAVAVALWAGALWRWRRTSETHPDFRARGDMVRYLLVFLLTLMVVLIRSWLPDNSPGFWACSVILLLLSIVILTLVWRLFNAYRQPDTK